MLKKNIRFIFPILVFLIFGILIADYYSKPKISISEIILQSSVIVDNGVEIKNFSFETLAPTTALSLLQATGLLIKIKSFSEGVFIESIGDNVNGDGGKYWMYYVNNKMPIIATDRYQIQNGDRVEFKFEAY